MSWHYSRALVVEYSAAICLDGVQSAPLNTNPTPQVYLSPDRLKAGKDVYLNTKRMKEIFER